MAVDAHRRTTKAAVVFIATTVAAAATALAFFAYFIQLEQIYFSFCFSFRHYLLFRFIGDDDVDDNDGVLYFLHPATYWAWSALHVSSSRIFECKIICTKIHVMRKIICNNDTRPPHRALLFADAHFHYYFVQFFPSSSSSSALLLFYSIHDRLNIMPFAMHYITMHTVQRDYTETKQNENIKRRCFSYRRGHDTKRTKKKYEKRFVFLQLMRRVSMCASECVFQLILLLHIFIYRLHWPTTFFFRYS